MKYDALAHAMQSGVKAKAAYTDDETNGVDLRVGVNMAMVEHAALTDLLMEKGVITEEEYLNALDAALQHEVRRYEAELSTHFGSNITLG